MSALLVLGQPHLVGEKEEEEDAILRSPTRDIIVYFFIHQERLLGNKWICFLNDP